MLWTALALFKIWMVVDAYQRRAEGFWYFVIWMPFGALAYFLVVKLKDFRVGTLRNQIVGERHEPLGVLKYRAERSPSLANLVVLGHAYERLEQFDDAQAVYRDVLSRQPEDREALYGLAVALMGLKDTGAALDTYGVLYAIDPDYKDYSAALSYAEALWKAGEREQALALLERVVADSCRINHRLAYAHYLAEAGREAPARRCLEQALLDYEDSPDYVRRRDRSWADRVRARLAEL